MVVVVSRLGNNTVLPLMMISSSSHSCDSGLPVAGHHAALSGREVLCSLLAEAGEV